jgi:hypothetical protein
MEKGLNENKHNYRCCCMIWVGICNEAKKAFGGKGLMEIWGNPRKWAAIENGNERESEKLIIIISIIWMNAKRKRKWKQW